MRVTNELLANAQTTVATLNTSALDLTHMVLGEVTATLADSTPANKTWTSGLAEVDTFNFPAKASVTDGDYCVQYDYTGAAWAVALDPAGTQSNTPTGALWVSIPAANKTYLDIHTATTAASVATAVKTAFNALTGFTAVVTASDGAADGHLANTATWAGVVTAPAVKNKDDTGAGGITVVRTTTGTASPVAPTGNTVTVTGHGYATGLKVRTTTTGGLPTGLATSTDYYLIKVDTDTLKFASSLANAQAGTAIALTGYGTGVETIAVQAIAGGTVKMQKSADPVGTAAGSITWVDVPSSSQAFPSLPGSLSWSFNDLSGNFGEVTFAQLRAVVTVTAGQATATVRTNFKGA